MNRSRWTAVIFGGLMTGGLVLAALAFWTTQDLRAQAGSLSSAASWMPDSASVVGFVDMTDVMASPISEHWKQTLGVNPDGLDDLERFKQATGMDPFSDFFAVGFSAIHDQRDDSDEDAPSTGRPRQWGLALHGELDPERILAKIETHRAEWAPDGEPSTETHQGTTVHRIPSKRSEELALAFPSSNLVLAGETSYVKAMLDVGAGQQTSAENRLFATWGDGWLNESTFWIAGGANASLGEVFRAQGASLPPLEDFAIAGRLDGELSLLAKGRASDVTAAAKLADVVRGLVALGSLQGGQPAEIEEILGSVQVSHNEDQVTVAGRISYDAFESLSRARRSGVDEAQP